MANIWDSINKLVPKLLKENEISDGVLHEIVLLELPMDSTTYSFLRRAMINLHIIIPLSKENGKTYQINHDKIKQYIGEGRIWVATK